MAKYSAIKAAVNAYIKQNGRKEITGKILNAVLNATIDSLGKFYQFAGEALPTDDPGTPDQNLTYLAGTAGTYTNFGGLTLDTQEIALLMWDGEWKKQTLLFGIQEVDASVDNQVGTPSVDVDFVNNVLTLSFHNIKGDKGDTGDPAGFGQVTASVDDTIGNPSVQVQTSGEDTAKNIAFEFHGLRGETGITSVVVSVDNTTGNPACSVSLVGQVLHLDFTGLKGLKGDTGVSADYPITIYNGLDSDATDQALAAAQGKVLDGKVSQLGQEIGTAENVTKTYSTLADCSGMFWGGDKVYAANASYNSYVFAVKRGISYSWNNGLTFQKFNAPPTIGSAAGHIGLVAVSANTPWEADADYWLMLNVNPGNLLSLNFTTYARGIKKDIADNKSNIGTLANLATTDKTNLVNAINEVKEGNDESILSIENEIGNKGETKAYSTIDDCSGMFWGGDKVYAANASYNSYVFAVKKGVSYSWDNGLTFQKFNVSPTIGSAAGHIGTLAVSANTPWEADADYWLMINVNPGNLLSLNFTTYARGIIKEIGDINGKIGLPGIKIVCFGDSLTEFAGTDGKTYSDWIAQLSGADIVNCGIGGTQLRQRATPVTTPTSSVEAYAALDIINLVKAVCDNDFTKQVNAAEYLETYAGDDNTAIVQRLSEIDFSTVNLVTIFAGTNDFALGGHLGTTGSTDVNTTLGAINEIVRLLLSTYPNLHIVWFSPVVRWADAIADRNAANWVDSWQGYTTEGKTLLDYNDAIISEVEKNFIPVADMLHTMGWTKYNFSEYFLDTDGVHPRNGFYEIAQKFISFILATRAF